MRFSPTLRHLMFGAASIVGLVLIGCGTDNGDAQPPAENLATVEPDDDDKTGDESTHPEFDASFQSDADGAPPSGDPTPPDGDQCIDTDDPGGAENVAKGLNATDDCDNDYKTVEGVAKGAVDVDFYKLSASDKTFCSLDTDFEALTTGTELCVYARCKNSTADAVTGCAQGVPATSDIGMKGCCAAAPGHAVPEWDCSGFTDDDSADFFIRVKQLNANKCLSYKFSYRY